ncbi:hypothetical protein [Micromonospora sp. NPDC002717]|uniref:hypothetical protein n=1 Tax=Micromonospora sp. NPDC002717 TaxID=3154424 RepID=UPI0033188EB1
MTNAFAMLRPLPISDRDKDVEILALRHQITVQERQLGKQNVRFDTRSWCCSDSSARSVRGSTRATGVAARTAAPGLVVAAACPGCP